MALALKNIKTNKFYSRFHSGDPDEKTFFYETDENSATLFENTDILEAQFEAKLLFFNLSLDNKSSVKLLKKLMNIAKNFEVVRFDVHHKNKEYDPIKFNFYEEFKNILIYQTINHSYNNTYADFYTRMKTNNNIKKYIVRIHGPSIEEVINLLGDDIIHDGHKSGIPLIGTNRKTDINLLKLCFNNSDIDFLETKKLKSLT